MKPKILLSLTVLLLPVSQLLAGAWIDTINIVPAQPSNTDPITFNIAGQASNTAIALVGDDFGQIGTSLQLDLYFYQDGIGAEIVMPWNYSKQIQPLSPGTYNLQVTLYNPPDGSSDITLPYQSVFTVTPEPASIALLSLGLVFLKKRK